jgi:hypothetical protein
MNMIHMRPFGTMNSQHANFEKNTKTSERMSHQKNKKKNVLRYLISLKKMLLYLMYNLHTANLHASVTLSCQLKRKATHLLRVVDPPIKPPRVIAPHLEHLMWR